MKLTPLASLRQAMTRARRHPVVATVVEHPVTVTVARVPIREKVVIVAAMALTVSLAIVIPAPPTEAEVLAEYIDENAQSMAVSPVVATTEVTRAEYTLSPGIATLAAGGTNRDWAQLVLLSGGWPQTDSNITVIMRWMRQENGTNNWWNRNNPLNNGWGSGGGGGTGRYANLVIAAQKAAEALGRVGGYSGIVAALSSGSTPTATIESAIWASPWASGHYANGGHWSYAEVPVVKSPAGTWG
jgi:hypothetical protein